MFGIDANNHANPNNNNNSGCMSLWDTYHLP